MSRKTELIDAIAKEKNTIMELTQELQEPYRILGGHLVSVRMLVPENQWQEWLSANCDINHEAADVIMAGEYNPQDINRIMLSNSQSPMLAFNDKNETAGSTRKKRLRGRANSKK